MRLLMVDNYDSFTYNIVQYLAELGAEVHVVRNDEATLDDVKALVEREGITRIVISPGPCSPNEAGISVAAIKHFAGKLPVLGVCLGHQAIGQAMGGIVEGAKDIVHGKAWDVKVLGGELFAGLPEHFEAVRYHSLAIRRNGMPNTLTVDAETADGEIMAVSHATRPVFGVQFHPESIGSQFGKVMLANFLKRAGVK